MEKIDFNQKFSGFKSNEELLVDTGVLLALNNKYDAWHKTVKHLFNTHILQSSNKISLYITPSIVDEITHLSKRPLENYKKKHRSKTFTVADEIKVADGCVNDLKILIQGDVLKIADGDKNSVLKQIELYKELGSADALNATVADKHGLSFLTVDGVLANNIANKPKKLSNIHRVYYTTSAHRTY